MRLRIILLASMVVLATTACGKQNPAVSPESTNPSAEIQMTAGGFDPLTLTVKKNTQVIFRNTDSKPHWPESDLAGFNSLQGIPAGQSYSFSFTQVGTWIYTDHLNKKFKGSVIVTE